jgi:aerobic-type carbon monoxide dehydrogenase small subunit (CoxS/CutS family)
VTAESPSDVRSLRVTIEINGSIVEEAIEPRMLLSDFIRDVAGLTGTHVGCEHGVCGACTVQFDGEPVRSCLMFAAQAPGHAIRTIEALDGGSGTADHPLQRSFSECHALQCGFCTPGFIMSLEPLLAESAQWSEAELRAVASGNLCRCTGYVNILAAVRLASERMAVGAATPEVGVGGEPGPSE